MKEKPKKKKLDQGKRMFLYMLPESMRKSL